MLVALIWSISLVSILLMLLRPRGIAEAWWITGGAALLVVTRLLPLQRAAHAVAEGMDVYLFLAGMMILAELAREEKVFDWAADLAAKHAGNSPARLFALVYGVGIIITALLSNDATAVVLTPAVLAVVRRARVQPMPYLLACALIANAASFVFPISNPANLVVFNGHVPPLASWLSIFLLPSLAAIVLTFISLRFTSRHSLRGTIQEIKDPAVLSSKGRFALAGLLLAAGALIVSSALGLPLGAPTAIAAFFAMGVAAWRDRGIVPRVIENASWGILPLVAGLFVIVEALQGAGLLSIGVSALDWLALKSPVVGKFLAAFAVAIVSNGMNNLPAGLMSGAAIRHAHESGLMAHATLIGVDLGPNLSVTGSLATILWLIALRRENVHIAAWEFFKTGVVAMPIALAASLLVLRH